jgi:catechol 2,3-dioxygenase-like lactoylglutathione lyase family enzyme
VWRASSVEAMNITIHSSFLPHTDPEASLAFYRDVLGFEVRLDVGYQNMRWITVGPAGQPDTAIVLHPPGVGNDVTEDERELILELIAKGSYFGVNLATDDLDGDFARIAAAGADVVQEPIDQDYGVRDAAFRDPAGNMIRMQQADTTTTGD